jgi:rare lipoprotein A
MRLSGNLHSVSLKLKQTKKLAIIICWLVTSLLCANAQQSGKASYYSKRATGAKTSSGIRLHHDSLVCAHRTYPFGTKLLVRNLTNDKEVIVTVVDRGPYRKGRIIDLTYAAAEQLGMISKGVVAVEVTEYHPDKGIPYALDPERLPEIDLEEHEVSAVDEDYNAVWTKNKREKVEDKLALNTIEKSKEENTIIKPRTGGKTKAKTKTATKNSKTKKKRK